MRGLGPLIYKDFTVAGRRWPTYLWRSLSLAALGVTVVLVYMETMRSIAWAGPSAVARAGADLTFGILVVTFVLVSLGAPAGVIRGIVEERERKTLALLIASPLQPWRVAFGKTIAAIGRTAITMLGIVPLLFLALSFGGTQGADLLSAFAHIAAGGLLGVTIALPLLAVRTRGPLVIVATYGSMFALTLGPLLIEMIWWFEGGGNVPLILGPILYMNPFQSLLVTLDGGAFPWANSEVVVISRPGGVDVGFPAVGGPLGQLFLSGGLALAACTFYAWTLGRDRGRKAISQQHAKPAGTVSEWFPIWWYETRIRIPRQSRRTRVAIAVGFALIVIVTYVFCIIIANDFADGFGVATFIFAVEWMVLLLVNAAVRGAWAGGDPRSEIPLLVTPASIPGIALEKIWSVLGKSLIGLGVLLLLLILSMASWDEIGRAAGHPIEYAADTVLTMVTFVVGIVGLATLGCLLARVSGSATRGTAGALSIFFGLAIGLPFFMALFRFDEDVVLPLCAATDPIFLAFWLMMEDAQDSLAPAIGSLVLQAALVIGLIWYTTSRWERISARRA